MRVITIHEANGDVSVLREFTAGKFRYALMRLSTGLVHDAGELWLTEDEVASFQAQDATWQDRGCNRSEAQEKNPRP